MHDNAQQTSRLAAQALTIAGGLGVLVSLFLTWSRLTLRQLALMALNANGSLGGLTLTRDAWATYAGAAAALALVAVAIAAVGALNRIRLILPVGVASLAALVFVVIQLAAPPVTPGAVGGPTTAPALPAHGASGAGETVALIALVLAAGGMWALLQSAHSERRRYRAIGAAARSPRAAGGD